LHSLDWDALGTVSVTPILHPKGLGSPKIASIPHSILEESALKEALKGAEFIDIAAELEKR
jgi:hypothetical protein